jgi:hypothetical protein
MQHIPSSKEPRKSYVEVPHAVNYSVSRSIELLYSSSSLSGNMLRFLDISTNWSKTSCFKLERIEFEWISSLRLAINF